MSHIIKTSRFRWIQPRGLILLLVLIPTLSMAEIKSLANATNLSGKQRMLTQRMMMNYALIGQNITYKEPNKDQQKTVTTFDSTLAELAHYKLNPSYTAAITATQSYWIKVKPKLLQTPNQKQALVLQKELNQLLDLSHQITQILSKEAGNNRGPEINKSGRQRMLSQRLASLYMLKSWRVKNFKFDQEFTLTLNEFKDNQTQLKQSKETTADILKQLAIADRAFIWFEMTEKTKSKKPIPSLILRSSNTILNAMDKATLLYAEN